MQVAAIPAIVVMAGLWFHQASAQDSIQRHEVMRHSLDPAREVIQVRVDIPVGGEFGRHSHPGPEIAYVLQGAIEYRIDGKPPVTLREGQALFIPAGAIHAARNVGSVLSTELATYVVETGKPILVKAE